jgi:hypothetical protein
MHGWELLSESHVIDPKWHERTQKHRHHYHLCDAPLALPEIDENDALFLLILRGWLAIGYPSTLPIWFTHYRASSSGDRLRRVVVLHCYQQLI